MMQRKSKSLIFSFLSLLFLFGCEGKTVIVYSISERDANEIVVLLSSKGIEASKSPAPTTTVGAAQTAKLWDISVPAQNVTQAIAILNQAGLPRVKETTLLDLFGESGLVPSDLQDRIRYQEGLSDQLANTIRKMDGIIDADVQISFSHTEEAPKEMTASVYIKHRGILDNPNSPLIIKIKRLVASSVPNLKIENVTVVPDRAVYSEIAYPPPGKERERIEPLVSIWGISISRNSVFLFRSIFYLFLILLFLSFSLLGWLIWKFYPLIERRGGLRALFSPQPFRDEERVVEEIIE